jgi:membrane-bound serine protease (ClpP class)
MIVHPVILIPKLIVVAFLVILLVWLHGILTPHEWLMALFGSIIFFAAFVLFMAWLLSRLAGRPGSALGKGFVLQGRSNASEGFIASDVSKKSLLGKTGVTLCMLRPAGKVLIDQLRVDAVSDGEFIPKDTNVQVVKVEGNRVVVNPLG